MSKPKRKKQGDDLGSVRKMLHERFEQQRSFADELEERKLEFDMQPLCANPGEKVPKKAPGEKDGEVVEKSNYVPFEIMEQIFAFLPPFSILNSVCYVAKGWYLMSSTNVIWKNLYLKTFHHVHLIPQEGLVDTSWRHSFLLQLEAEVRWRRDKPKTRMHNVSLKSSVGRGGRVPYREPGSTGKKVDQILFIRTDQTRVIAVDVVGDILVFDKKTLGFRGLQTHVLKQKDKRAFLGGKYAKEKKEGEGDGEGDGDGEEGEGEWEDVSSDDDDADFAHLGGGRRLGRGEGPEPEEGPDEPDPAAADAADAPGGGGDRAEEEKARRERAKRRRRRRRRVAPDVVPMGPLGGYGRGVVDLALLEHPLAAMAFYNSVVLFDTKDAIRDATLSITDDQIVAVRAMKDLLVVLCQGSIRAYRISQTGKNRLLATFSFADDSTLGRLARQGQIQPMYNTCCIETPRVFHVVLNIDAAYYVASFDARLGLCVQAVPLMDPEVSRRIEQARMGGVAGAAGGGAAALFTDSDDEMEEGGDPADLIGMPAPGPGGMMPGMPPGMPPGMMPGMMPGMPPGMPMPTHAGYRAGGRQEHVLAMRIVRKKEAKFAHVLRQRNFESWNLLTGDRVKVIPNQSAEPGHGRGMYHGGQYQVVWWDAARLVSFAGDEVLIRDGNSGKVLRRTKHGGEGGNLACLCADDMNLISGGAYGGIMMKCYGSSDFYWMGLTGHMLEDEGEWEEEEEGEGKKEAEAGGEIEA